MTIEQLIEESKGNVKILDLIKYPELHDLEVKPVEKVTENSNFEELNEPTTVWRWLRKLYNLANLGTDEECEHIYRELMSVNFKVVQ